MSIACMVLGIASFALSFFGWYPTGVFGFIAVACGIVGLVLYGKVPLGAETPARQKMARLGRIFSLIGIIQGAVLAVVGIFLCAGLFSLASSGSFRY